jgi:hypothetical protein
MAGVILISQERPREAIELINRIAFLCEDFARVDPLYVEWFCVGHMRT